MVATTPHSAFLQEGAKKLGVELSQEDVDRLLIYLRELIVWNAKIDLVSQTDPVLIIRKHFLDSSAILPHVHGLSSMLDIGSGAGFPGIPLAILLPNSSVSLIEGKRKRVSFLKQVARKIDGENLTIYEGRAEILAQESVLRNAFDLVISRATWDTLTFFRLAILFVRSEGKIFAMKGPRKDEALSSFTLNQSGAWGVRQYDYALPFGPEQRRLVIFARNVPRDT